MLCLCSKENSRTFELKKPQKGAKGKNKSLTAYALYVKDVYNNFEYLKQMHEARMSDITARWKNLDAKTKEEYEQLVVSACVVHNQIDKPISSKMFFLKFRLAGSDRQQKQQAIHREIWHNCAEKDQQI